MQKIFATALLAACIQAENMMEGRELSAEMQEAMSQRDEARRLWDYHQPMSKTFNNGRNRRSGLYYDWKYQLASSVIFARHGERDAGESIADVSNPDFATDDLSLTEKGAMTMNSLGEQIASSWAYGNDNHTYWVDFDTYSETEVYAFSGATQRMSDSTVALLDGMFGASPSDFPITGSYADVVTPSPEVEFLLLSAPEQSCPRYGAIEEEIELNSDVVDLRQKITDFLEEEYFPRLRELLANDQLTADQLYAYANYISWAKQNMLDLEIGPNDDDLTEEELRYNQVAVDADNYMEFALTKDQWYVQTQELQMLYKEVSRIVRGDLNVEDADIITKYFGQADVEDADMPKLITLVGDEETSKALLGIFNNLYLPTPAPGSVFAVDFYKCKYHCYYYRDQVKVEVSYCPDGNDLDGTCTILNYDSWIQDYKGATTARAFEHYLERNMEGYEMKAEFEDEPMIADVCAIDDFTPTVSYQDTDRYFKDLLTTNGFDPMPAPVPEPDHHNDWHTDNWWENPFFHH